jgi:molybdenum cofactor biosynthesis protein A
MLYDNHNRPLSYLRLAVTDRCNLRCYYCMPPAGIDYLPRSSLLTFEEMERIVRILAEMGIKKVRITGGEPFVRSQIMDLLLRISAIPGIGELHITTNGVLTAPHVPRLKDLGIRSVNLSLDTLDRHRFRNITRRDELPRVMDTFHALLEHGIPVKINAVVMENKNTEDIFPLAELTRNHSVSVRFIEEMPFNGTGDRYDKLNWTYKKILEHLRNMYGDLEKLPDPPGATALHYRVPGYAGTLGIIPAFSRTFCGSCNRIRITAQGWLKTCLYDNGVFNIRDMIRAGKSDEDLKYALLSAFSNRPRNGFEAEASRGAVKESMSVIGG